MALTSLMKKLVLFIILVVVVIAGCKTGIDPRQEALDTAPQPIVDDEDKIVETTPDEVELPEPVFSYSQDDEPETDMSVEKEEEGVAPQEDTKGEESMTASEEEGNMANPLVLMKTNKGEIKIELFMDTMPVTAGNFKKLVEEKFYDGVIFHRVIPGFMAQGGDPTGTGTGGPGYTIKDEFTDNNKNLRGTLSMANAGPNTGGSQFFINVVNNNFLDSKHPVFAKVIEGMDVVDAIVKVPTGAMDKPVDDVVMQEVRILE